MICSSKQHYSFKNIMWSLLIVLLFIIILTSYILKSLQIIAIKFFFKIIFLENEKTNRIIFIEFIIWTELYPSWKYLE